MKQSKIVVKRPELKIKNPQSIQKGYIVVFQTDGYLATMLKSWANRIRLKKAISTAEQLKLQTPHRPIEYYVIESSKGLQVFNKYTRKANKLSHLDVLETCAYYTLWKTKSFVDPVYQELIDKRFAQELDRANAKKIKEVYWWQMLETDAQRRHYANRVGINKMLDLITVGDIKEIYAFYHE